MRTALKFNRYCEHQLFNIYLLKKEKFAVHFASTFFQELNVTNVLESTLLSILKPCFIYWETLIDTKWEFGEQECLWGYWIWDSPEFSVFLCFVQTECFQVFYLYWTHPDSRNVPRHVGGIPRAYLEEQCPSDMWFQQDGARTHFQREVKDFLSSRFLEKCVSGCGLLLGHFVRLALLQLGSFVVHQGCCVRATIGRHVVGNCSDGKRCCGYSYPRLA
jgi:hypothetical protein